MHSCRESTPKGAVQDFAEDGYGVMEDTDEQTRVRGSKVRDRTDLYILRSDADDIDRISLKLGNCISSWLTKTSPMTQQLRQGLMLSGYDTVPFPAVFQSICICDDNIMGLPVYMRSQHFKHGPRAVRVGNAVFANMPRAGQRSTASWSISPQRSSSGRPLFFLEYVASLLPVGFPRPKDTSYVFATTIDITELVNSSAVQSLADKTQKGPEVGAGASSTEHLFLEDCSRKDDRPNSLGSCVDPRCTPSRVTCPMHKLLHDVALLHQDFFMLTPCEETKSWNVAFVSQHLKSNQNDYGFSSMDAGAQRALATSLSDEEPFSASIRWGPHGWPKVMYCQPMFRREFNGWMCFLVDASLGNVWAEGRHVSQRTSVVRVNMAREQG